METNEIEEKLARLLSEGELESMPKAQAVRMKLPFKTEIRIQTERDPVAEETKEYRKMAREVDERYAKYDDV
jgi:hypothetical protein